MCNIALMDKFTAYLKTCTIAERKAIAERARAKGLRCSEGHLTLVANSHRRAGTKLVNFIVEDAGRKLRKADGIAYLWEEA